MSYGEAWGKTTGASRYSLAGECLAKMGDILQRRGAGSRWEGVGVLVETTGTLSPSPTPPLHHPTTPPTPPTPSIGSYFADAKEGAGGGGRLES